ncbi:MAG: bifunctional phosphoserine phosphatase/homoserine phosphotransferase ThrH [Bacteroidales bacterium]|nr:bifunctional phosphoserine phosphatase/homoserine phosphotransferase ThrH [Bacteroidales bacterium]
MYIICCDLEGVFVPEIWINVSRHTGIDELKLTTRDISNYDILMKRRLDILRQHSITLQDIQKVISSLGPLPGAVDFIDWVHKRAQLIIVSDTFREFADPLLEKMGWPVLLCHDLTTDKEGNVLRYNIRQLEAKMKTVEAFQSLNYNVIAIGDSYNDISMLRKAEVGILYNPSQNVIMDNPDLKIVNSFEQLKSIISDLLES